MTADVQRELAEAVMADPGLRLDVQCGRLDHAEVILTLLPTVQALIADAEKRAAAGAAAAHTRIVDQATDLCWKATPFTEDESGAVAAYLLPAGVVHRLLGALQGAGYPAAFRAIADPDPAGAASGEAGR